MAEERNYEQFNEPSLCANNCGFFANNMTLNLCSKCYRDHILRENQKKEMEALITATSAIKLTPSPSAASVESSSTALSEEASSKPSRCCAVECRKRIGLIGFKCKCGETYCGTHRFPEDHSCTYDFKTVGKKAIEKANPMVMAPKVEKILSFQKEET